LTELLSGSDCDELDQDFEDRQIGLDAWGLVSYPEDTVVYGGIPFGSILSPQELLRQREEYETHLNREDFGLTTWWYTLRSLPLFIEDCLDTLGWSGSVFGVEFFRAFSMS
jgi:hypothetical protein